MFGNTVSGSKTGDSTPVSLHPPTGKRTPDLTHISAGVRGFACAIISTAVLAATLSPSLLTAQLASPQDVSKDVPKDNRIYVDNAGGRASTSANPPDVLPPDQLIDLQRLAQASTGQLLPIFGRNLFTLAPSTFAPADQISVLPDYVVGPGDEILLRLWGHDSLNSQLTVDTSGSIYIPNVGAIHVAGLRFDELQDHIKAELSRTYKNFDLSVNLGHLRSIQIYVVGEARRPGLYTVSSLSTAFNALFVSGGPTVGGSMRSIQVSRQGKVIGTVDLYDLALHGDKSKDVRLLSGDVIFVPSVGPQTALAGSFRHPAIYELKAETTLDDVINLGGGLSTTASKQDLSLERIGPNNARRAIDLALSPDVLKMPVRDGDVLYAKHISLGYEQTVTIRGNLANPGQFSWHAGMKLSDIIPDRMSLLTNGYWASRNELGIPTPLFAPLNPATREGSEQQRLTGGVAVDQPGDARSLRAAGTPTTAGISAGEAAPLQSAASALTNDSVAEQQQSLRSPNLATGASAVSIRIPAPEIDWAYAVIERLDSQSLKSTLIPFNLGRLVMDHDASQDLELKAGDIVTILSQVDVHVGQDQQTKFVRLEGEFVSAGTYSVNPGETLQDLITRAGGLSSKAYLYGSSFTRESARVQQQQRLDEYVQALSISLQRSAASSLSDAAAAVEERNLVSQLQQLRATGRIVLEFNPRSDGNSSVPRLPVEDGDVFRVPSRPLTVSVVGAVYGQNVFLYDASRRVQDYLLLAGNPTRIADKDRAFVIRADGSVYSHERAKGVWKNVFDSLSLNPGDTIVVPEKPVKFSGIRQFLDYSQLFSSAALGAAAIAVIR